MKFILMLLCAIFVFTTAAYADEPATPERESEKEAVSDAAERKTEELGEVVVTATRTERATEEVPAAVTAVGEEDIKDTRLFGISEALQGVAGVQSESKSGGYDARLIIRGAGLKARYGVREIMVLMDGVPITDPDGMTRLDFVDTALIKRIDVVKGPNSTMYGANAAGGVINIITKNPFEESTSAKVAYGSYNTQMYNLNYSNRIGETYFTASGSRRSTDGWRDWNEFSTNHGSLKVGHITDGGATVEGSFNYTRAYFQLPGALSEAEFESDITQRTSEVWRHSERNSEIFYLNLRGEKEIGNVTLKPLVFYETWEHNHPVTGLINEGGADVLGAELQTDVSHDVLGMGGMLTAGVTAQVDDAEGDKFTYRDVAINPFSGRIMYTLSNTRGLFAEHSEDTTSKWGVFMQESLRPTDDWIIDIGARYDQVRFNIHEEVFWEYNYGAGLYLPNRDTIRRVSTFDHVSLRAGAVYKIIDQLHAYGNLSTGFQTPQSSELSVNPELDPMTVYNYEGGLKARTERGDSADLAVFYMVNEDEIVQSIEPGNISSYSNAGRTEKFGVELSGKVRIIDGLYVGGSYTYSNFTFKDFKEPVRVGPAIVLMDRSGNSLPYIPEHQYSLFVKYRHPWGFKCGVDTCTWGSYQIDNANTEKYKGYAFVTNAMAGFEYAGFDLTVTVNNVFDERYAVEVTKDTSGNNRYKPGAPLTAMVQLAYNF